MKDRREGKHRDNRRSTEMKEKRQSREKQRKRQWGAGEEWHWGWTRRNGHHRTPAERADRWRHADKKQQLLAGRVKRKKKVSGRWRGGWARGGGESAVRRKRGEEERDWNVLMWESETTHTHTHTKDSAPGTCWQGGRVSRGRAKHDCRQNKDVSSARGQEKHSGPEGGQTRTRPGWCRRADKCQVDTGSISSAATFFWCLSYIQELQHLALCLLHPTKKWPLLKLCCTFLAGVVIYH